jgi:hypothetical protein
MSPSVPGENPVLWEDFHWPLAILENMEMARNSTTFTWLLHVWCCTAQQNDYCTFHKIFLAPEVIPLLRGWDALWNGEGYYKFIQAFVKLHKRSQSSWTRCELYNYCYNTPPNNLYHTRMQHKRYFNKKGFVTSYVCGTLFCWSIFLPKACHACIWGNHFYFC